MLSLVEPGAAAGLTRTIEAHSAFEKSQRRRLPCPLRFLDQSLLPLHGLLEKPCLGESHRDRLGVLQGLLFTEHPESHLDRSVAVPHLGVGAGREQPGQSVAQRNILGLPSQCRFEMLPGLDAALAQQQGDGTTEEGLRLVRIEGQEQALSFDRALIATGSRPIIPNDWKGIGSRLMDSLGALELEDIPDEIRNFGPVPIALLTSDKASGATQSGDSTVEISAGMSIAQAEQQLIAKTLAFTGGNREQAAKILGIGARTLYRKLKEYELS